MRQRKMQGTERETRNAHPEPLADGIVRERKPRGFYAGMSDEEIIAHARKFIAENGTGGRKELAKANARLYDVLRERGLLDDIGLERKLRDWAVMEDNALVAYARGYIAENGILGKADLAKAESKLFGALVRRRLLDSVGLESLLGRDWASMDDEGLVASAKKIIEKEGITGRMQLEKADSGLYDALRRRKLLERIGLENKRRAILKYAMMGDDELVESAGRIIAEKKLGRRGELKGEDGCLYAALQRRRLLAVAGLGGEHRNWSGMGREMLKVFAKRFISEKGISGRTGLAREDKGMYEELRLRGLLGGIGLEKRRPDWAAMSEGGLIEYTKKLIKEKGINGRKELSRAHKGLYDALRRRKLLDAVFSEIESARRNDGEGSVLSVIKEALCKYSGDEK